MSKLPEINGLVLAGGMSSRMGIDKRLIDFHGAPQGEYLFNILQRYCDVVYTSCNARQQISSSLNPLRDMMDVEGPVNGILSAFEHARDRAWFIVAVDMPNVNDQIVNMLITKRCSSGFATCFYNPHQQLPEPLCTIWEPAGLSSLYIAVRQGLISPRAFLDKNREKVELVAPDSMETLLNVNIPNEVDKYRSR